jgi:hypothetical protein
MALCIPEGFRPSYEDLYELALTVSADQWVTKPANDAERIEVLRYCLHSNRYWARNVLEGKRWTDPRDDAWRG